MVLMLTPQQSYMLGKYCAGFPALLFPWYQGYAMIVYAKCNALRLQTILNLN